VLGRSRVGPVSARPFFFSREFFEMPKYILRKGERPQAFMGTKLEQRGCCYVTVREHVMFAEDCVVDTGDLSMQSWVDLNMLELVSDEQSIELIENGYSIPIAENEFVKIESVTIGDSGIADVNTVVVGVDGNEISDPEEVKTEEVIENKEPEIESFGIVEDKEVASEVKTELPKVTRKYKKR